MVPPCWNGISVFTVTASTPMGRELSARLPTPPPTAYTRIAGLDNGHPIFAAVAFEGILNVTAEGRRLHFRVQAHPPPTIHPSRCRRDIATPDLHAVLRPSAATPWTASTIERDRCGTARVQTCNIRGCIEANLVGTFDYRRAQVAAFTPVSRGVTISSSTFLSSQRTMPISKLDWIDLRPMIPTGACELFTIVTLLGAVDIVHQPARQGVEEELEGALRTVQEGFAVSCHAIEMASPCSAAASLLGVSGGDRPFQVLRRTCDGGFQQATRTTGRAFPPAMLARRCDYSVRGQGAPGRHGHCQRGVWETPKLPLAVTARCAIPEDCAAPGRRRPCHCGSGGAGPPRAARPWGPPRIQLVKFRFSLSAPGRMGLPVSEVRCTVPGEDGWSPLVKPEPRAWPWSIDDD
jgi:hypothetical protein